MQYGVPAPMMGRFLTDLNGNPIPANQQPMDGQFARDNWWRMPGSRRVKGMPPLKGMISMSPCDDGTVTASVFYREATAVQDDDGKLVYEASEYPKIYTTSYTIDVPNQAVQVSEPWIPFAGDGFQVQKMPIPCWSVFSSLRAKLEIA
jgi:hypothetical protein